jgi:hypothetical protein
MSKILTTVWDWKIWAEFSSRKSGAKTSSRKVEDWWSYKIARRERNWNSCE